jgi:hypothetical protein
MRHLTDRLPPQLCFDLCGASIVTISIWATAARLNTATHIIEKTVLFTGKLYRESEASIQVLITGVITHWRDWQASEAIQSSTATIEVSR